MNDTGGAVEVAAAEELKQASLLDTVGTAFHAVAKGSPAYVRAFFPVGCMHSIAARKSVRVSHDAGDGGPRKEALLDVYIYVGQNVHTVLAEFRAFLAESDIYKESPATSYDDLLAGLVANVERNVDDGGMAVRLGVSGYVKPWKVVGRPGVALDAQDAPDEPEAPWRPRSVSPGPGHVPNGPAKPPGARPSTARVEDIAVAASAGDDDGSVDSGSPVSGGRGRHAESGAMVHPVATTPEPTAEPPSLPPLREHHGETPIGTQPQDRHPHPPAMRPPPLRWPLDARPPGVAVDVDHPDGWPPGMHPSPAPGGVSSVGGSVRPSPRGTFGVVTRVPQGRPHLHSLRRHASTTRMMRQVTMAAGEPTAIDFGWSSTSWDAESAAGAGGGPTIYTRGPLGENPFHMAILLRSQTPDGHTMVKYLAETFGPRLVSCPYQTRVAPDGAPGLYDGETPLHMAIVFRDYALVSFLVEHGADVRARCYGEFFNKSSSPLAAYRGRAYYGEFPASFAVSMGERDIVEYLAFNGADVMGDRDSHGNSALHLAVIHSRPKMYDFVADYLYQLEAVRDTFLHHWPSVAAEHPSDLAAFWETQQHLNVDGHSPLTLAALLRNQVMFTHCLFRERKLLWTYGPIRCFNIKLDQIDTDASARAPQGRLQLSALEIIVNVGEAALDLLNTEAFIQVLNHKWTSHARGYFYFSLGLYLVVLILFSLMCQHYRFGIIAGNPSPILKKTVQTPNYCSSGTLFPQTQTDGSVLLVPGTGGYNCDLASAAYTGPNWDVETTVLEIGSLVGVWLLGLLELWDVLKWMDRRITDSLLMVLLPHLRPPRVPQLFPIPGQDLPAGLPDANEEAEADVVDRLITKRGPVTIFTLFNVLWAFAMSKSSPAVSSLVAPAPHKAHAHVPGQQRLSTALLSRQFRRVFSLWATELQNSNIVSVFLWVFVALETYHFELWRTNVTLPYNPELAAGAVSGYLFLLYFAPGFKEIGHFQVIIARIFTRDLPKFFFVYLVFLSGFGLATFILIRSQYVNNNTTLLMNNEFGGFGVAMIRLFRHSLGDMAWDVTAVNEFNNDLTVAILIGFTICANVVLLNLLIGLMTTTMTRISDDALRVWRLQWAQLILEMEGRYGTTPLHQRLGLKWLAGRVTAAAAALSAWAARPPPETVAPPLHGSAGADPGSATGSPTSSGGGFKQRKAMKRRDSVWAARDSGGDSGISPKDRAAEADRRASKLVLVLYTEEPSFKRERHTAAAGMRAILDLMAGGGGGDAGGGGVSLDDASSERTSKIQAAYHPYLAKLEARKTRAKLRVDRANKAHADALLPLPLSPAETAKSAAAAVAASPRPSDAGSVEAVGQDTAGDPWERLERALRDASAGGPLGDGDASSDDEGPGPMGAERADAGTRLWGTLVFRLRQQLLAGRRPGAVEGGEPPSRLGRRCAVCCPHGQECVLPSCACPLGGGDCAAVGGSFIQMPGSRLSGGSRLTTPRG